MLALTSAINTAMFTKPGAGTVYIAMKGLALEPVAASGGKIPTIKGPAPNSQGQQIPYVPVKIAVTGSGAGRVFQAGNLPGLLAPVDQIPQGVLYVAQRDIVFAPSPETISATLPAPVPPHVTYEAPPAPVRKARPALALGLGVLGLGLAGAITHGLTKGR